MSIGLEVYFIPLDDYGISVQTIFFFLTKIVFVFIFDLASKNIYNPKRTSCSIP